MNNLPRNVWILAIGQALIMSVNSCVVFVGGIVGSRIAPEGGLATLPVASTIVGTALFVVPVTLMMKRIGRRKAFLAIIVYSILIALFTAYSIHIQSFWLFCLGSLLLGVTAACVMQFRFAAMESVKHDQVATAASSVLLGGIAAAFIGPETALLGKDLMATEFTGSFVLLAILFLVSFGVLLQFRNPPIQESSISGVQRSLLNISKQSVFWVAITAAAVGYTIMSFIMTATPVSMHVMDGHSLSHTKWVIQSHIVAMFLPSLVTGKIINTFGVRSMMTVGLLAYILCIAIAFSGHALGNYWVSLILLGIGWNFLFIGGTTLLPTSYMPQERFKVQALNDFMVFGSQAVAATSAGWFVFALGWETLLLCTLPLIAIQLIVVLRWGPVKTPLATKVETAEETAD